MKTITIGRNPANDDVINDVSVDDFHCQITQYDNKSVHFIDLDSKSGTFVNEVRISGIVKLNPDDIVRIGNYTLTWKDYFEKNFLTKQNTLKQDFDQDTEENKKWIVPSGRLSAAVFIISIIFMLIKQTNPHGNQTMLPPNFDNVYMNTIHPWSDEYISVAIPNCMEQIIIDSSTINFEEKYMLKSSYPDILRISMYRLPKTQLERNDIEKLHSFVNYIQKSAIETSYKVKYTTDTIECLADKNGYFSLYYIDEQPDTWGKSIYISGKDDYYTLIVWTHQDYKYQYKDIIDRILCSFDIKAQ